VGFFAAERQKARQFTFVIYGRDSLSGLFSTWESLGQDQKAEPTKESNRKIFVDGKAQLPRQSQKLLAWRSGKIDRPRRVEAVKYVIAGIPQGL
jgi:hypothetical protein